MTTATKTRPRKTKKKRVAKKKATSQRGKGKTKKPKWSLITFKKIEAWRQKLGLSKSGMAEALQVTNSTYHNWRRGTTVPHVNQQKEILQRIEALESNVAAGKDAPRGKPMRRSSSKGAKARKGTASSGTRNGSSRNRLEDYGLDGGSNGADPSYRMDTVPPGTPSASAKVPRDDIAAITVAFIQSQKNVSAGSVFEFVKGLREVM